MDERHAFERAANSRGFFHPKMTDNGALHAREVVFGSVSISLWLASRNTSGVIEVTAAAAASGAKEVDETRAVSVEGKRCKYACDDGRNEDGMKQTYIGMFFLFYIPDVDCYVQIVDLQVILILMDSAGTLKLYVGHGEIVCRRHTRMVSPLTCPRASKF